MKKKYEELRGKDFSPIHFEEMHELSTLEVIGAIALMVSAIIVLIAMCALVIGAIL